VPSPTPEEEEAMRSPAERACDLWVDFEIDGGGGGGGRELRVRLTDKHLDEGTIVTACLDGLEKPYDCGNFYSSGRRGPKPDGGRSSGTRRRREKRS
jgi:hypothetical protein